VNRIVAVAALAAAVLVPLAAPAAAQPSSPAPGQPVHLRGTSTHVMNLFYQRADGSVGINYKGGGWSGTEGNRLLGGAGSTAPTGLIWGTGDDTRKWVLAAGTNGAVYYRESLDDLDTEWTPWTSLGGFTTQPPAITCQGGEAVPPWVYLRGADGALWEATLGSVPGWHSVGGSLLTGPATVGIEDPGCEGLTREVVAIGADSAVWRWRNGTWSRIGGASALTPTMVRDGDREWVFVVGTDKALWVASRSANFRWSKFTKIGGAFTTAPSAAIWTEGPPYVEPGITVAAYGTNGKLYRATRLLSSSGPWKIEVD
jgi:hypothetical protein